MAACRCSGPTSYRWVFVGPLVGYGIYRALRNTQVNMFLTVFLASAFADLFTYITTSLELALAYPAAIEDARVSHGIHGDLRGHADPARDPRGCHSQGAGLQSTMISQMKPDILMRLNIFPEEKLIATQRLVADAA